MAETLIRIEEKLIAKGEEETPLMT